LKECNIKLPPEVTPGRVHLFSRLHQLEVWFRELVFVEMKCRFGNAYWQECEAALKRSKRPGLPAVRAMKGDKRHPHMATPETDPLWFISFDSLTNIVQDRRLWHLFAPYLTTKRLVRAKIEELMPVRHRIAHARAPHPDDVRRVDNILADLDQGFWRFCTSYNHDRPFIAAYRKDPVCTAFGRRMFGGYVETKPNEWAYVANRRGTDMDVMMSSVARASARRSKAKTRVGGPGVFYDVRFSVAHTRAKLKTADVLAETEPVHANVMHVFLDALEDSIRVTVPSVIGAAEVIRTLERFYRVCMNSRSGILAHRATSLDSTEAIERYYAPMVELAMQWPHYVIPPNNPLSFLDPGCPCSFFGD
jgi:hypothetical protein